MKKYWKSISTKIPKEYKTEFERQIIKDNFARITRLSIVLFFIEFIIYFIIGCYFNSSKVVSSFVIANFFIIPIIIIVNIRIDMINIHLAKTVQYSYALIVIIFGIFLALVSQSETDLIHMYLMAVLCVTLVIEIVPKESLLLLSLEYCVFYFLLPYYQENADVIFVIRQNALIFNIFAWLQSRMVLKMKLSSFLNNKIIQEKNIVLQEHVKRDSMTGLFNHVTSHKILSKEIENALNSGNPLNLILLDIDNFKKVNDNYGHLMGDEVITKISDAINNCVKPTDFVGRYGGEEFIIIMPDTTLQSAQNISKEIQYTISDIKYQINTYVTLSGGISQFSGESINDFIRITDEKLYKAKKNGKNRFQI
ncbi:MAG: GGDEF domain-containing protein [Eubacteriaceae bacterium]